jgi:hypothetical protein
VALGLIAVLLLFSGCARQGNPVEGGSSDAAKGFRLVDTYSITGYAEDVYIAGGVGIVAASQGGMVILDMTDPAAPDYLGMGITSFKAEACSYEPADSFAFVTDGTRGLRIFDITDPSNPDNIATLQSTRARDVVTELVTPGELYHIYLADGESGFRVAEFEFFSGFNLWFGNELYHEHPVGSARGIDKQGDLVFLAMEQIGLAIYDVGDLSQDPVALGTVDTPGEARDVVVSGDYAYVADWRAGLQVIDVSDPLAPSVVASAATPELSDGIDYHDGMVYVADHTGGLRVFDVTEPTEPFEWGYFGTPYASNVLVTDEYVYVADRDWGVVILEEE